MVIDIKIHLLHTKIYMTMPLLTHMDEPTIPFSESRRPNSDGTEAMNETPAGEIP